MTYAVWKKGGDGLLAMGSAQECAQKLGLANKLEFEKLVGRARNHTLDDMEIHVIDGEDPMACPCDICDESPGNPFGKLSASCDAPSCARWFQWFRRHWYLNVYGGERP